MASLTLIRGIPGSGKSTVARAILHNMPLGSQHFEADMFFVKCGIYNFDKDLIWAAHSWCQASANSALARGCDVIVSNTFTSKRELKPYFEMTHKYGLDPSVICMQSNFGSAHGVPDETLVKMKTRFCYDISDMFLKV